MAGERLKLHIESPEFRAGVQQQFWRLREQVGDLVYIEVIAPDRRVYTAEFNCSNYEVESEPIGCRFVDPSTHRCTKEAWPQGNQTLNGWLKWDSPHFFICWPEDRQALVHHPEWRPLAAWKAHTNKLVRYLNFLQQLLYIPERGYQRAAR